MLSTPVLFTRSDSPYLALGCDCYDITRDARTWPGGRPGIFHPPCRSWGQLAHFAKPRPDERELGNWSMRMVHLHGVADRGHRPPVCWFVTLTYVGVHDWKADHISKALQVYRNWCQAKRVACRYTWVAELQGRGAVHYHLLIWLPVGVRMPHWDKPTRKTHGRTRPAFWPHGMTNTDVAKAGVGYLMKYLSKLGELTRFPKGLRLYGIGGLTHQARSVRSWLNLPEWVKASYGVGDVKRVASG